jgi:hypothetical protein
MERNRRYERMSEEETEQYKKAKEFMNEAMEEYDKGNYKASLGKLLWCIGWLADEIKFNKVSKEIKT